MGSEKNIQDSETYSYLVKKIGKSKIKSRYKFLYEFMESFIEQKGYAGKVQISRDILDHVLVDYFVDIDRMKDFQGIQYTNDIKIYAYTSFWILRHKPLQIICKSGEIDEVFINEELVSCLLRSLLFSESSVSILPEQREKIDDFIKTMNYFFRYRDFSAKNIEIMIMAFEAGRSYQYCIDYKK